MEIDLAFIWAAIIAFGVLAYVMLDGFDLGIGILFPMIEGEQNRDLAMNSVAPVWDGNETWLVLGGGGLFAVFPLAYATILPALYAPLIAMLIGLIFRGVSFEFRWRTRRGKYLWDWGFAGGSILAAFAQGVALGALVQGIEVVDRAYAGGWWDWLTPFSIATGVALMVGYVLLGSTWLFMKTTGELQDFAKNVVWSSGISTLVLIGLVSMATRLPALLLPGALVRLAHGRLQHGRAAVGAGHGLAALPRPQERPRRPALPGRSVPLRALLRGHRHLLLSLHGAPQPSPFGRPQRPTRASISSWWARWSWCRSS